MDDSQKLVDREMAQARLLMGIFSRSVHRQVVLKGGLAIRSLYNSPRYTKDIDLGQDPSSSLASLQHLMRSAIKDSLGSYLRGIRVSEPKQTDTVARWKISGMSEAGSEIHLTVEVSRRGVPSDHVKSVYFDGRGMGVNMPGVLIDTYDESAIVSSKVAAMLSDNRVAPRDVYDLYLLFGMNVVPARDMLNTIIERSGKSAQEIVSDIWSKLESMPYSLFQQEVLPFIPDGLARRVDESTYESMRIVVGSTIEKYFMEDMQGMCM